VPPESRVSSTRANWGGTCDQSILERIKTCALFWGCGAALPLGFIFARGGQLTVRLCNGPALAPDW
jgi:hypothetical protein